MAVLTNTNPAVDEKVPATPPPLKVGNGSSCIFAIGRSCIAKGCNRQRSDSNLNGSAGIGAWPGSYYPAIPCSRTKCRWRIVDACSKSDIIESNIISRILPLVCVGSGSSCRTRSGQTRRSRSSTDRLGCPNSIIGNDSGNCKNNRFCLSFTKITTCLSVRNIICVCSDSRNPCIISESGTKISCFICIGIPVKDITSRYSMCSRKN